MIDIGYYVYFVTVTIKINDWNVKLHLIAGYAAYIGMLLLEHAHNNPILRVFCQILQDKFPEYGQGHRKFTKPKACDKKDKMDTPNGNSIMSYGTTDTSAVTLMGDHLILYCRNVALNTSSSWI